MESIHKNRIFSRRVNSIACWNVRGSDSESMERLFFSIFAIVVLQKGRVSPQQWLRQT